MSRQLALHPESTLADIYKSFVQERFGAGHLVADTLEARRMLLSELASAGDFQGPALEPCGASGRYVRADLSLVRDAGVPFQEFFHAFIRGLEPVEPADIELWAEEWRGIAARIEAMGLRLPCFEADRAAIDAMLREGRYAVHHSQPYSRAYRPRYRIIGADLLKPLLGRGDPPAP